MRRSRLPKKNPASQGGAGNDIGNPDHSLTQKKTALYPFRVQRRPRKADTGHGTLGGKIALQCGHLCLGFTFCLCGLIFPVWVVALQFLVGLIQLILCGVPLSGQGGDGLLLAFDISAVQIHDFGELLIGDVGENPFYFLALHIQSFPPCAFYGVAPSGCTVLRRAGHILV